MIPSRRDHLERSEGSLNQMNKALDKVKNFLKKFFLIDDTPHKVAAGAALGVFWGIMPGEGLATTLITASILRFNRLSATAGVMAVNTWTTVLILPLAAFFGGFLFKVGPEVLINDFKSTYHLGIKNFFTETIFTGLLLPLLVGFFIVSATISMAFYFLLYFLLKCNKVKFR